MNGQLGFLLLGLGVGGVSGLLGIGGGVLLIPALMLIFGFDQPRAQGTSLAVLAAPVALFAVVQYYKQGFVDVGAAMVIAVGFAVGAFVTAGFISQIPTTMLSQLFGSVLLVLGMRMVLAGDRGATVVAASLIAFVSGWLAFFLLRWAGARFGVRPYFKEIVHRRSVSPQTQLDYQI
ncbi:MAG TPA: TSUP family transporter [Planctomycetota bacterium]|nr:TSUP family transporter [Planctomycetota bacterium]